VNPQCISCLIVFLRRLDLALSLANILCIKSLRVVYFAIFLRCIYSLSRTFAFDHCCRCAFCGFSRQELRCGRDAVWVRQHRCTTSASYRIYSHSLSARRKLCMNFCAQRVGAWSSCTAGSQARRPGLRVTARAVVLYRFAYFFVSPHSPCSFFLLRLFSLSSAFVCLFRPCSALRAWRVRLALTPASTTASVSSATLPGHDRQRCADNGARRANDCVGVLSQQP
jgi:hypothetical protein